ncbi:MAG: hypothetical protein IPP08_04140 [Chlorobiota bacterium]|nr:hypothetical protein [Chlorobiota bacterium]QQS67362.1 MAG: hypothetical protein IPP08_04140 [Chlorobiota bacterium]
MQDTEVLRQSVEDKIRICLKEYFPDFNEFPGGAFTVSQGSAVISIFLRVWHEGDIAVTFTSQLVTGAVVDANLMEWLLKKNSEINFGAFGLLFDNTIVYSHTLPGMDLSDSELTSTLATMATIADFYDGVIVEMAGGKLGIEYEIF